MRTLVPTPHPRTFAIKMWPPTQHTRLIFVGRIINKLTSKSIFTQKYGSLTKEEAAKIGKEIENTAFNTVNELFEKETDVDECSAVKLYVTECSKNIVEVLKRGSRLEVKKEKEEKAKETVQFNGAVCQEKCFNISNEAVSKKRCFDNTSNEKPAFIEEEEAEELLRPLKEPGNSFTKICFSNRSFGLGAALVAKPILESIKNQLKEVDLSDFVACRPEYEALQVMYIFSTALEGSVLRSLDLSNNALGEKGVRAFGKLLKSQTRLEELYLINSGISGEAAEALCELIPSTENLKVLHFDNNMTGNGGALAIAEIVERSPLLEEFRCSSARVESEGAIALCEALETCLHLKRLDLRDNMIGVKGGKSLARAIMKRENRIEEIYLNYMDLQDKGAIYIAYALKRSSPLLKVLDMAGNDITAEAVPCLMACIMEKEHLVKLILCENELRNEGAIEISAALGMASHVPIKEIDMSTNGITRTGAMLLAQAVVGNPGIKLLNLNGNFISEEGVEELKSIFKSSPDVLGSFDENHPERDNEDLERKMKTLGINSLRN